MNSFQVPLLTLLLIAFIGSDSANSLVEIPADVIFKVMLLVLAYYALSGLLTALLLDKLSQLLEDKREDMPTQFRYGISVTMAGELIDLVSALTVIITGIVLL